MTPAQRGLAGVLACLVALALARPAHTSADGTPALESRVPNPQSRTAVPESRLPNPQSRIAVPESRLPNPESRNILFIVTDDQAEWSVGAYGNTDARTPHIDRLAREGVRFSHAFTPSPVCSPSRATLISGRYGTEVGITDWINPAEADAGIGLPPETTTWVEALQRAGYRTGLVGKWHLGTQPRFRNFPCVLRRLQGATFGAVAHRHFNALRFKRIRCPSEVVGDARGKARQLFTDESGHPFIDGGNRRKRAYIGRAGGNLP